MSTETPFYMKESPNLRMLKLLALMDILFMQNTFSPIYWAGFGCWALWWKYHEQRNPRMTLVLSIASLLLKTTYMYLYVAFTYIPAVFSGLALVYISSFPMIDDI